MMHYIVLPLMGYEPSRQYPMTVMSPASCLVMVSPEESLGWQVSQSLTEDCVLGIDPGCRRVVCHPGLYVFFLYGIHASRLPVILTGIGAGVNVSLATRTDYLFLRRD